MTAYIVEGEIVNDLESGFLKPIDNVVYLPVRYPVNTPLDAGNAVKEYNSGEK